MLRHETRENQAAAIFILRTTVRQEFADIRNNTNVGRALWSYIQSLKRHPTRMPRTGIEIAPKGKRKRNTGVHEDDDEFRPQPIRAIGRPAKTRAKKTRTEWNDFLRSFCIIVYVMGSHIVLSTIQSLHDGLRQWRCQRLCFVLSIVLCSCCIQYISTFSDSPTILQ